MDQQQIAYLTSIVDKIYIRCQENDSHNKNIIMITTDLKPIIGELALLIHDKLNIDLSSLFEKIYQCFFNLLDRLTIQHSTNKLNKSQPVVILEQIIQPSSSLMTGVSISKSGNPQTNVTSAQQLPWYQKQVRSQKILIDKATCTSDDIYLLNNKMKIEAQEHLLELDKLFQFTNEQISLINEVLQHRQIHKYTAKGTPEELNKLINQIKFKKDDLDTVLKNVEDANLLKEKPENYESVEQQIKQHILLVQKATAEKVFDYCKSALKKKLSMSKSQTQIINRQSTLRNSEDCRCSVYVGELMTLQTKSEQQLSIINKQQQDLKEKDIIISALEDKLSVFENEKQEMKQQINLSRRNTLLQKQNSFLPNEEQSDQNNISPERRISRGDRTSIKMQKSQLLIPFSLQNDSKEIQKEDVQNIIKKDKLLERLIILANYLDKDNQERRLSQMKTLVESKGGNQLIDMYGLVKDIEDNDFHLRDSIKTNIRSQQDLDDIKSLVQQHKQFHSQALIDQSESSNRQRFQSSRDLQSPKTLCLEQIKEIDENNKQILLVPMEYIPKISKHSSQESFNESRTENSPSSQRVKRTKSNAQQLNNKNIKIKRTNSIKVNLTRKSSVNKSNEVLSNPYGVPSTTIPLNSASITERGIHQQIIEDQFKFEQINENDEQLNRSTTHNISTIDKTNKTNTNTNHISALTTQHHTPKNSSRKRRLKSTQFVQTVEKQDKNQSVSQRQEQSVQFQLQPQMTNRYEFPPPTQSDGMKFQQAVQVKQEQYKIQDDKHFGSKQIQSRGTHIDKRENQISNQQNYIKNQDNSNFIAQKLVTLEPQGNNIQLISIDQQIENQERNRQYTVSPSFEQEQCLSTSRMRTVRKTRSPDQTSRFNKNESERPQIFKQHIIENILSKDQLENQIQQKNTDRNYENKQSDQIQGGLINKQDIQVKDYLSKQKEKLKQQQIQEKILQDQNECQIEEQEVDNIIIKAKNQSGGYFISSDLDEQALQKMYQNLTDNNTELSSTINQFYLRNQKSPINYLEFKSFVNQLQQFHKKCGKDCIHITRFYLRLGFVPQKYLNKRRTVKMGKPVVLPGFPKFN